MFTLHQLNELWRGPAYHVLAVTDEEWLGLARLGTGAFVRRFARVEFAPTATQASALAVDDPVGFAAQPRRYTTESGRETIDRIRDALGDEGFVAFCIGTAMKYEDRAGKKAGSTEDEDLEKANWYRQMARHVRGEGPDPRSGRTGFQPYVRPARSAS